MTQPNSEGAGGLPTLHTDDRVVIVGQPRTGKTTLLKYIASLMRKDRVVIIDPLDQYRGFMDEARIIPADRNPMEEFNDIAKQIMARGNVTLIVEEAQKYLPESGKIGPDTMAMLNRGRNYGIGVIASTQRIQTITKNIWDISSTVIFFRPGFQSRSYIKGMLPPEVYSKVISLPNRYFVYYSLETEDWGVGTLKIPGGKEAPDGTIPASARLEIEQHG